jgi:uncharacterized protein YecT (DUF1311 family)
MFMPKIALSAALAIAFACGFALPAAALDCSKAKAPDEKALCADPQALAADDAMVKAYQALSASSSEAERKMLQQAQRAWIKSRADACMGHAGAELGQCLREKTDGRRRYLLGMPEAGPGSGGKLVPVTIQRLARKGAFELDINVLRFAPATTPAERLFNAAVDKLLKDAPNEVVDYQQGLTYSYDLHLTVTYASPQFISAHVIDYLFGGGAHGNGSTTNINIDVAKGSILSFGDVFAKNGESKILAECTRQILAQKTERLEGEKIGGEELEKLRSDVEEGLKRFDKWSFAPGKANVAYDTYSVGSHAEGPYECEFRTQFLQPLVKAGFALP